jgi:DNA-directed DNA polymerase III PolC
MVEPKKFFGLHAHTGASNYDGLGKPHEHFEFVLNNGMNGMAITEHGHANSFAEAYKAYEKLKKEGRDFKYVPGVEFYLHPDLGDWEKEKEEHEKRKKDKKNITSDDDDLKTITVEDENATRSKRRNPLRRRHHVVILPKNNEGLESLFSLVSFGYTKGQYYFPRIDYHELQKKAKGNLIATTACLGGPLAYEMFMACEDLEWEDVTVDEVKKREHIILPRFENVIDNFVEAVGEENFFLELQFNKLAPQHAVNYLITQAAKKTGIKLIVTADSHYPGMDKWKARELYRRLRPGSWDDDPLPNSVDELKCELYPKNADQMWDEYLEHKPKYDFYEDDIVCEAIERSYDIAHDMIEDIEPDRKVKLPSYTVPEGLKPMQALAKMAKEGLEAKGLDNQLDYIVRLNEELQVIKEKDFAKYFLTMKAITDLAHKHMLVGFGRGSASASLLCYVLDITGIDPLKYDLLFSRFLSKDRSELPDIDSDFSDRDLLRKLLMKEFGDENVIAISNINSLSLKSLTKDLAKFYGIEFVEANNAIKNVDKEIIAGSKKDDLEKVSIDYDNAMKYSLRFREFIEKYPNVGEHILELTGEQKAISRHAGGIILSENIFERMPTILSKNVKQTPWTKDYLEPLGWVKYDLLGLETLKIIEQCIALILERHHNIKNPEFEDIKKWYDSNLHPNVIDLDDQHVYEHVYRAGNFAGIFQCSQRDTQRFFMEAKPRNIIDIAALTSVYRPGPMEAHVHRKYSKAKQDPSKIKYPHPLIKEVLEETYGYLVFQEQAMKLGNVVGGLPLDDCDTLRKVVSKKPEPGTPLYMKALELEKAFIEGALNNGISKSLAESLYENIKSFAKYSFNKCLWENTIVEVKGIGNTKIKDVNIGDFVNSINGWVQVKDRICNGKKKLVKITTESGKTLICTLDHKIQTKNGMVPLKAIINNGMSIVISDALYDKIQKVETIGHGETYDLEVDHPDHSFYANGISVSNSHAVSYAINSYLCAWLLTYYEPEWLCAYVETQLGNPDEKAKAISELKGFGYDIANIDINKATDHWTVVDNSKKFMPSFISCKGAGKTAVAEIESKRPYSSIYDFLWDDEGNFKHSKCNKRNVSALLKIGAFDSLNCVGDGKLFSNYAHMFRTIIDNWMLLKKRLKKDNWDTQCEKLDNLAAETDSSDWSIQEKLSIYKELMGEMDLDLILSKKAQNKLREKGYVSINEFPENAPAALVWFILEDYIVKKTQYGKPFLIMTVSGISGKQERVCLWDWTDDSNMDKLKGYLGYVNSNERGYSAKISEVMEIPT